MSSQFISSVRIERVSDPSDVPALASVFDIAILASGDNFRELLKRYVEDPYTEVERHLRSALSPPAEASTQQHFVLKAVWPGDDDTRGEGNPAGVGREMRTTDTIVGMAYWSMGYIDIPKVDPFEQQTASAPTSVVGDESTERAPLGQPIATSPEPEPSFDFYTVCRRPVRNTYISHIQGKKHICKSYSRFQFPGPQSMVWVPVDILRAAVKPSFPASFVHKP
jgi:hypothetical protein